MSEMPWQNTAWKCPDDDAFIVSWYAAIEHNYEVQLAPRPISGEAEQLHPGQGDLYVPEIDPRV